MNNPLDDIAGIANKIVQLKIHEPITFPIAKFNSFFFIAEIAVKSSGAPVPTEIKVPAIIPVGMFKIMARFSTK